MADVFSLQPGVFGNLRQLSARFGNSFALLVHSLGFGRIVSIFRLLFGESKKKSNQGNDAEPDDQAKSDFLRAQLILRQAEHALIRRRLCGHRSKHHAGSTEEP